MYIEDDNLVNYNYTTTKKSMKKINIYWNKKKTNKKMLNL